MSKDSPDRPLSEIRQIIKGAIGSNTCMIPVQWMRLIRHYPKWFVLAAVSAVAVGLLGIFSPWFLIAGLFPIACVYFPIRNMRAAFTVGTTNPAIVVSLHPFMAAVYANLSMSDGFKPAVRVVSLPNPYDHVAVGERIPAACTYSMSPKADIDYWINLHPILIAAATTDEQVLAQAMHLMDPVEWAHLFEAVKQVPQPYKPGFYFVNIIEQGKPAHEGW